jgi:hypothetical protein
MKSLLCEQSLSLSFGAFILIALFVVVILDNTKKTTLVVAAAVTYRTK